MPFHFHLRTLVVLFATLILVQCNQIQSTNTATPSESPDLSDTTSKVALLTTDYQSPAQIVLATTHGTDLNLNNTADFSLGTSAVVRVFENRLFVLHDAFSAFSSDNLQIIDLDSQTTLAQHSVGNGTNPHDAWVHGNKAYITLYNPGADVTNRDSQNQPGDLIVLDLDSGQILSRISFADFLTEDGDKNAHADQMRAHGNFLYVLLQDLESNTFAATTNGKLAKINLNTNSLESVLELTGRNPTSLALSDDGQTAFIAHMATYNPSLGNFDLTPTFGGVEVVDLSSNQSVAFFPDNALGGYVERVRWGDGKIFTVISRFNANDFSFRSRVTALEFDGTNLHSPHVIDDSGTDIREMVFDNGFLWISRRQINTNTGLSEPMLSLLDCETETEVSNASLTSPGMSFAIID